jgi:hypothetical protein
VNADVADGTESAFILCAELYDAYYGSDCTVFSGDKRDWCYFAVSLPLYGEFPESQCDRIVRSSIRAYCTGSLAAVQDSTTGQQIVQDFFTNGVAVACYLQEHPEAIQRFPSGELRDYFTTDIAPITANDCFLIGEEAIAAVDEGIRTDDDQDGLNTYLENLLGTDDANPDTDGDGFTDATEIANEYNPLGSGTFDDYFDSLVTQSGT